MPQLLLLSDKNFPALISLRYEGKNAIFDGVIDGVEVTGRLSSNDTGPVIRLYDASNPSKEVAQAFASIPVNPAERPIVTIESGQKTVTVQASEHVDRSHYLPFGRMSRLDPELLKLVKVSM